ncbi:MAG: anti-sigma factor antagonist [Alphaproteobacteria bacterium]|nr:anti-sigma factor antagonist [Alphaproteobacteria bacterium]
MDYNIIDQNNAKTIRMSGQFTFPDNPKFKSILIMAKEGGFHNLTLDFMGVTFIDSAGLGMLLLLRDQCAEKQIRVSIAGAQGQVAKIFSISNFDRLFSMQ